MARFVLVHGAFSGAWVWEPVADRLRSAGHTVDAFDVPGSGEDQTPAEEVKLDAYAARICDALAARGERAILVGHSMDGVAITQAAGRCPARISLLVYVAAFMPQHGQSLVDLTHTPEGQDDQVQANLVVDGDPPMATLPAVAAPDVLYASCTAEQAAWATARMRPQPLAPFATPVAIDDPRSSALPPRLRDLRPGSRDPARASAPDDQWDTLRRSDRTRHGPLTLALGNRRAGEDARPPGRGSGPTELSIPTAAAAVRSRRCIKRRDAHRQPRPPDQAPQDH